MNFAVARRKLLDACLKPAGIEDERLLRAMGAIPRHVFVAATFAVQAYADNSLPIGFEQTISKPTVVGRMLQALNLRYEDRVLEIGTGSGYQTAILSRLVRRVYSVEIIEDLLVRAKRILAQLECYNVVLRKAGAEIGLTSEAPFQAIVVSACFHKMPKELLDQLDPEGGRLVAPLRAGKEQRIKLFVRQGSHYKQVDLGGCVFVPILREVPASA